MGILAAGVMTLINPVHQMQKAKDSQRKSDLKQIQTALEMYRSDNGVYPVTNPILVSCSSSFTDPSGNTVYMQQMPCDPKGTSSGYYNGGNYYYRSESSMGEHYVLGACLENENDSQGAAWPGPSPSLAGSEDGCESGLYYVVSDP